MAFNAGSIEATLTLDRTPFTAGLKLARAEAKKFADEKFELTITPTLKEGALAAIKARIEKVTGKIEVGLNLKNSELAAIRARLARVAGRIDVKLNLVPGEIAALRARLRDIDIGVKLGGIAAAIAQLRVLERLVDRLDGRTINIQVDVDIAGALAAIATLQLALAALRGSLGSIGGSVGGGAGGFSGLLRILPILLGMIAIAPALALAGAAITVAWGAIATAVAAIPPILLGLGALIAPIVLGFDGIKKAAEVLSDEMETLKTAVSAAFERGLIPAFNTLAAIFPTLTDGSVKVADAISLVARDMATFLTQADNMSQIGLIFDNVAKAVEGVSPGLQDIVSGLIDVASQTALFEGLTDVINNFGAAFKESVIERINDGTLRGATEGLTDVLNLLGQAFVGLVDGGIQVFAAAAPGLLAVMDAIGSFFTQFDWGTLGAAAGAVFQGIADGIALIPVGTIQEIEDAFVKLGDAFKSQAFTQGLADIASVLPDIISGMANMTEAFGTFMSIAADVITVIGNINTAFGDLDLASKDLATSINDTFRDSTLVDEFAMSFEDMMDEFERSIGIIPPLNEEVAALVQGLGEIPPDTTINVQMTNLAAQELEKLGYEVTRLADGTWDVTMGGNTQPAIAVFDALVNNIQGTVATIGLMGEDRGIMGVANALKASVDGMLANMGITARDIGALAIAEGIRASIDATVGWIGINGRDVGALNVAGQIKGSIDGILATLGINAQDRGAFNVAGQIQGFINSLVGVEGVNAADRGATGFANSIKSMIDGLVGVEGVNAADRGAAGVASGIKRFIDGLMGMEGIDAQDRGALAAARAIVAQINAMRAVISITQTITQRVLAPFTTGSGGGVVPTRFGRGGVLAGFSPGRDVIPALLSPGESVLVPELTRMFGKDTILALNKMASGGRPAMAFKDGGIVGPGLPLNGTGKGGAALNRYQSDSVTLDNASPDVVRKLDQVIEVLERIGMNAFVGRTANSSTTENNGSDARRQLLNLRLTPR